MNRLLSPYTLLSRTTKHRSTIPTTCSTIPYKSSNSHTTTNNQHTDMAAYNEVYYPNAGHNAGPSSMPTGSGECRLAYFITRNNGLAVPLIPADELPFTVKLQNVPRVLTPAQTVGLQYIGSAPYTGLTFFLEKDLAAANMQRSTSQPPGDSMHTRSQSGSNKQFLAPDALARQALANNVSFSPGTTPKRPVSASEAKSWRRTEPLPSSTTTDATQSVIDAILNSSSGEAAADRIGYRSRSNITPPPSGIIPDQEKKVYCTHWILNGWCMYEQQGCRYKHEMLDEEGLKSIGIKHTPRWWKEQNAPVRLGSGLNLGGESRAAPTTVGVLMKPEDWLNKKREGSVSSTSSTEAGSASDNTSVTSEEESLAKGKGDKKGTSAASASTSSSKSSVASPTIPPARPSTPSNESTPPSCRKLSVNSDLIDFAPLKPLPSSPPTKAKEPTVEILKRPGTTSKPGKKEDSNKLKTPRKSNTTTVFVPAGESPEVHIADAKKRERAARQKEKISRTPSPAQQAQKDKSAEKKDKVVTTTVVAAPAEGLKASRWAPSPEIAVKRPIAANKSTCRPRRPASSSPAARNGNNGNKGASAAAAATAIEKK